jgi:hypothetical protein
MDHFNLKEEQINIKVSFLNYCINVLRHHTDINPEFSDMIDFFELYTPQGCKEFLSVDMHMFNFEKYIITLFPSIVMNEEYGWLERLLYQTLLKSKYIKSYINLVSLKSETLQELFNSLDIYNFYYALQDFHNSMNMFNNENYDKPKIIEKLKMYLVNSNVSQNDTLKILDLFNLHLVEKYDNVCCNKI